MQEDAFDPDILRAAREEIVTHVAATYKVTDLFKMFQTGDLANLDALDAAASGKLKATRAVRDAIDSPAFRAFVSSVTGCPDLRPAADCACNG